MSTEHDQAVAERFEDVRDKAEVVEGEPHLGGYTAFLQNLLPSPCQREHCDHDIHAHVHDGPNNTHQVQNCRRCDCAVYQPPERVA